SCDLASCVELHRASSRTPCTPCIPALPLHDALPISPSAPPSRWWRISALPRRSASTSGPASSRPRSSMSSASNMVRDMDAFAQRSEEHTSELQSPDHLVCRLLLEKKKPKQSDDGLFA